MIMATETLKMIVGVGEPLKGRLMLYNSLKMHFKEVRIRRNPKCELGGDHPTIDRLIDYEAFCAVALPSSTAAPSAAAAGHGFKGEGAAGAKADGSRHRGAKDDGLKDRGAADNGTLEVTGAELKRVLDTGRPIALLDVREPHEWEIARIERARLTPLSKFEEYIPELNPDEEIYLYCYKGKRSMTALQKLKERGFKHLKSLAGGIDRWSQEVDPSVPRY